MTKQESWEPIETAPKNGTLLDVRFDVASSEHGAAEFYAPGCTRRQAPVEPVIDWVQARN